MKINAVSGINFNAEPEIISKNAQVEQAVHELSSNFEEAENPISADYIYNKPKQSNVGKIMLGLIAAGSVGIACVAAAKNKIARDEIKNITEKILEKDKKIKEAEEKLEKAAEETEKKVKEAVEKETKKTKIKYRTEYIVKDTDSEEVAILKRINADLSDGLRRAGNYIGKLGHELEKYKPKEPKVNKASEQNSVNRKDNYFRRLYKKIIINFEFFKFGKRTRKGLPVSSQFVPDSKEPLHFYKPKHAAETENTISWEDAQNINRQLNETDKPQGFFSRMEGYIAKGIDSVCNFIRNL